MADIAEDDREKGFADDKCPVPNGTGWTVDVDVNGVSPRMVTFSGVSSRVF